MKTNQENSEKKEQAMIKLKLLVASVITFVIAMGCIILPGYGQQFKGTDFLGGNQSIYLQASPTSGVTYTYYEATNGMTNAFGVGALSLTNLVLTNGGAFDPFNGSVGTTPLYYTNASQNFGAQWNDVPLFADRNGNVAACSFAVSAFGATNLVGASNILIFNFAKLARFTVIQPDGTIGFAGTTITPNPTNSLVNYVTNNLPGNGPFDTWTVGMICTNSARSTMVTNFPSTFVQGAAGIRLMSVVIGANSANTNGYYIDYMRLVGFPP